MNHIFVLDNNKPEFVGRLSTSYNENRAKVTNKNPDAFILRKKTKKENQV